jgi:NADH-quinone oxidoreductase subunit M
MSVGIQFGAIHLVVIPLVAAVLLAILPLRPGAAGFVALIASAINVGAVVSLVRNFQGIPRPNEVGTRVGYQFDTSKSWLSDIGSRLDLGVDGLSLLMVAMTSVVMICALAYALWEGRYRTRGYYALLLLLESALMLVFVAHDLILFYVGFEAMLIPFYFLMGIWGGAHRRRATLKFIIYTFVGTLLMLVAIIYLGLQHHSFSFDKVGLSHNRWMFLAFVLAFAIKCPIFPFHGWLPDAYRSAPPEVAAVLSAVASKAGAYGLLRIVLPIFPEPVATFRWWIIGAAVIALLYGSLIAFRQPDLRGVIAYSSIGQMGLIVLGIFLLNSQGAIGAGFQMVNHGLVTTALFLLAGWIETTTGSGLLHELGGMARGRPVLATSVMVVGIATLAVPGSSVFASEFLILLGAFQQYWWLGAIASIAIVLAAMYMLRWISAILHDRQGRLVAAENPPDLLPDPAVPSRYDGMAFVPVLVLMVAVLALSFYPNAATSRLRDSMFALTHSAALEADR